jgi:Flp pilus assembly protein TadD
MGRLAQEARKLPQAVDAYRGAVRLDPKNGLAWANLGVCLHQSGDPAGALASIKLAVSLLPASADARRNLGAVLDDLGRLPEAQAAYEEATRLDPSSAVGWHGYGVVLQKQGLAGPAADAYRHALAVDPDKIESLANLASLRAGAGDLNEATALMKRAAALRPGDPTLRAASDALLRRRDAAAEGK